MSFIQSAFAARPLRTREQVMEVIVRVADELNMPDKRGACVCAGMCVAREAGADRDGDDIPEFWCPWNRADPESERYDHDSEGDDGRSVGYFQQQKSPSGALWWGPTSSEMDLHSACTEFMKRLKKAGYDASNAQTANDSVQRVQQSGRPQAYKEFWQLANDVYDNVIRAAKPPTGGAIVASRPDFNEINQIGWDAANPHGSERSQLPRNWFAHTEQGNSNAEQLATFLRNSGPANPVSYHYTVHEDPNDHGVTVCDVIDTDLYSWSVLNANIFSINGCFAGTFAEWDRATWLARCRNAIRVMAYLAVQDCKKYPTIAARVLVPPYTDHGSGISDHRFVTKALGIGSHTDVGGPMGPPWNGFPWDVWESDVLDQLTVVVPPVASAPPPSVDTTPLFEHPSTDVMTREIWDQLRGPTGKGWSKDGDRTPVETIWAMAKKLGV